MTSQKTLILALLTLLTAGGAALSYARLDRARDDALAGERDLNAVRRDLAEITANAEGGAGTAVSTLDAAEAVRRTMQGETLVGLQEKRTVVDTLEPRRLGTSGFSELPVSLQYRGVTLHEVLRFLHTLSTNDPSCRSTEIELSPSEVPNSGAAETWTADLKVEYLIRTPRGAAKEQQQQPSPPQRPQ